MSTSLPRKLWLPPVLATILLASTAMAATVKVNLEIISSPPGAAVTIDGRPVGVTTDGILPLELKDFVFDDKRTYILKAEKAGYAPEQRELTYALAQIWAKSAGFTKPKVWRIVLPDLVELERAVELLITNDVAGAAVLIDGKASGVTPLAIKQMFTRTASNAPWSSVKITVSRPPQYKDEERTITGDEAFKGARPSQPHVVKFALAEIQRSFPVEIRANVPGATVLLDDKNLGVTTAAPLKHTLTFNRADAVAKWPELTLKVQREGMEFRPPGSTTAQPAFTQTLTVESAAKGTNDGKGVFAILVDHLLNVLYVPVPFRTYELVDDRITVGRTNVLSAVDPAEQGKRIEPVTKEFFAEEPLALSRISILPESFDRVVFTAPIRETRAATGVGAAAAEIIGARIMKITGIAKEPLTDAAVDRRYFDIDPFVTADGKWLYYSSDRSRNRAIWRIAMDGTGGITQITRDNNAIDLEPAVSPDGVKLAYASRPVGSPPNANFYLWIANEDGTRPAQYRTGRSPAWSHDSKRVAFVSPDNKIWIMHADGSQPARQYTNKPNSRDLHPVWSPNDKYIIYASDEATDDQGQHNFDIWRVSLESGKADQLTKNNSFDSVPAISADGKYLYFFSNRGGRSAKDEALHIYRMELPPE